MGLKEGKVFWNVTNRGNGVNNVGTHNQVSRWGGGDTGKKKKQTTIEHAGGDYGGGKTGCGQKRFFVLRLWKGGKGIFQAKIDVGGAPEGKRFWQPPVGILLILI